MYSKLLFIGTLICSGAFANAGTLWGTGENRSGALGPKPGSGERPIKLAVNVEHFAAGYDCTLYITADGNLWGLGGNNSGRLGPLVNKEYQEPHQIDGNVVSVAAGWYYTLYIKADNTMYGLGFNQDGELGINTRKDQDSPVKIADGVKMVFAGKAHSLFIKNDNTLWGMGEGTNRALGNTTPDPVTTPRQIDVDVATACCLGGSSFWVKRDGTLWCVGNFRIAGGQGTVQTLWKVADGVESVSSGYTFVLFVKRDHSLWVMGDNSALAVGGALPRMQNEYKEAKLDSDVAEVTANSHYTFILKRDSTLFGAGYSTWEEFGLKTAPSDKPTRLRSGVTGVAAGLTHALFLTK